MILHALYQYYNEVKDAMNLPPLGMEEKEISYCIVIENDGSFVTVEDLRGNDTSYIVGDGIKRSSNTIANPFWDNSGYVLGWDKKGKETTSTKNRLQKFRERISSLCDTYPEVEEFQAVHRFYSQEKSLELEACRKFFIKESCIPEASEWISFRLKTNKDLVACNLLLANEVFSSYNNNNLGIGTCLVTGREGHIARLHRPVLKGTISLVNINKEKTAFSSDGKEQGENAPITIETIDAYTKGLSHLLSGNQKTRFKILNEKKDTRMVFVFWNEHPNENKEILPYFNQFAFDPNPEDPRALWDTDLLYDAFKAIYGGVNAYIETNSTEQFYVLGLVPGKARISVKLWERGTIQEISEHILQHHKDMNIVSRNSLRDEENPPLRSIRKIIYEASPPSKIDSKGKSKSAPQRYEDKEEDKWSLQMIQEIVESIVSGTPYPLSLQQACIERIRHNAPVTELRAAILKACINRKARFHRNYPHKELHMALDKTNTNKAYLLGRLFSHLEKIQYIANAKDKKSTKEQDPKPTKEDVNTAIEGVNASIRDRFYGSASSTPRVVLGRLFALSKHHLSKIAKEKGEPLAYSLDKRLGEIIKQIPENSPEFPAHLSLDEQSIFAVGYYHERFSNEEIVPQGEEGNNQEPNYRIEKP